MTTTATYRCRCNECGKEFDSSALVEIDTQPEYPGASTWKETVSPCCFADYEETDSLIDEVDDTEQIIENLSGSQYYCMKCEQVFEYRDIGQYGCEQCNAAIDDDNVAGRF